ncbi:hypothetical protein [Paenibacillus chitinolyticus]|uniref:hypothetical protein n=1 Tax=Paenibacillus chitinolyticus TaxID=79263 RepID=UPI003D013B63
MIKPIAAYILALFSLGCKMAEPTASGTTAISPKIARGSRTSAKDASAAIFYRKQARP